MRIASVTLLALTISACGAAPPPTRCEADPKTCYADGKELTELLAEPQSEARALRDRAVRYFERACTNGDKRGCEQALAFWAHAAKAKQQPAAAVDGVTELPVAVPDDTQSPDTARTKVVMLTRAYEKLAFDEALKQKTEPALQEFLKRFPHGEKTRSAEEAIIALSFEPVATEARATRKIDKVLEYAERNPTFGAARNLLVDLGLQGRTRAELKRIAALDGDGPQNSPRFRTFAGAARQQEAELAFQEASQEEGEKAVVALRAFRQSYAWSPRAEESKSVEAEKAFLAASAKKGEAQIAALHAFQTDYPSSKRSAEAHQLEVTAATTLGMQATTAAQYWAFLKPYANEPAAPTIRDAFADYLLKPETQESAADYQEFVDRFPTAPKKAAVAKRMRDVQRREAKTAAAQKQPRECANRCETEARTKCASLADDGPTGPRAMCVSGALRPCCTRCNLTLDSSTFASCK